MLQNSELILMLLDRWLDVLDNVVHAVGKKLSVLALVSMLTSNVQYVTLFLFNHTCSDDDDIKHRKQQNQVIIFYFLPRKFPISHYSVTDHADIVVRDRKFTFQRRIYSVERGICPIAAVCTVLLYCRDAEP